MLYNFALVLRSPQHVQFKLFTKNLYQGKLNFIFSKAQNPPLCLRFSLFQEFGITPLRYSTDVSPVGRLALVTPLANLTVVFVVYE